MSDNVFNSSSKNKIRPILIVILIAASLSNIFYYFREIILFLNTNLETIWGLLLVLILLGFFLGYRINQSRANLKPYFFDYGEMAWLIRPASVGTVRVEDTPYCRKCKVQYLVLQNSSLVCPLCQQSKDIMPLSALHKAVENIARTKAEGLDKLEEK
ncbi:MAG: hypothetical protein NC938_06115 [Candidatus Omnitrophica bacterium]|nr:hypothetical protein [Candidatus Omnitrophota bacterium]